MYRPKVKYALMLERHYAPSLDPQLRKLLHQLLGNWHLQEERSIEELQPLKLETFYSLKRTYGVQILLSFLEKKLTTGRKLKLIKIRMHNNNNVFRLPCTSVLGDCHACAVIGITKNMKIESRATSLAFKGICNPKHLFQSIYG